MRLITALLLSFITATGLAAPLEIHNIRLSDGGQGTRLVFDTSARADHTLFTLSKPDRVVIDIASARLKTRLPKPSAGDSCLKRLRSGKRKDGLRVVLDLKRPVTPHSFTLGPGDGRGYRLVVDLKFKEELRKPVKTVKKAVAPTRLRDVVVAIDAGHGGRDPGARGSQGTREKDVVMAIAKRLARLVDKEPGMRAYLVRNGDYYLRLRDRIKRARQQKADVFISIHADAFRNAKAKGSSVYVLSRRGVSSEAARWLANQENAADLVTGVSLDDKDELLARVLLDLSQTATVEGSMELASHVLKGLERIGKVHRKRVERAGFVVLKSPDIPSILVETAFISNPSEERKLRSGAHQQKLARAMLNGLRTYFRDHAPPGTVLAARNKTLAQASIR
jgi:N-acetylmuramoyl-L-alanine amidase